MANYIKQNNPIKIPTNDDKLIEEHFGIASTGNQNFSVAHMIVPPKWTEPYQNPEFDEITIMISGKKEVEVDEETIVLQQGESLLVKKGARVKYSNPFDEPAEYWSVCIPAFTLESVKREESE